MYFCDLSVTVKKVQGCPCFLYTIGVANICCCSACVAAMTRLLGIGANYTYIGCL